MFFQRFHSLLIHKLYHIPLIFIFCPAQNMLEYSLKPLTNSFEGVLEQWNLPLQNLVNTKIKT